MSFLSRRVLSSTCLALGLSVLCGSAAAEPAAEPAAEGAPRRMTPKGGLFSIEFPAEPTCDPTSDLPDCLYEDPTDKWILRTSYSTVELSGTPEEFLQKHLAANAEEGSFEVDHQEATRVDGYPALDYRLESIDGSAYRSAGRLVLIGTQLVDIEVGGNTLPTEDTITHFVNAFRVEVPPAKIKIVPTPAPEAPPAPAAPAAAPPAQPTPPSITTHFQASFLKLGAQQYQGVLERLHEEGKPWNFSVGMTRRTTQHKRDKKRDALVITEMGSTQEGKFENHFWIDAKTLLPYRWESRSPGASMRLEVVAGSLRGEVKGASTVKIDQPLGDIPLLFPGAPLELALSTLPLQQGFTGSVQVLDLEGLTHGKPVSTWRLSVPFSGPVTGLTNLKQDVAGYRLELLEHTAETEARKLTLWIESEKARRVLQVEALAPASRGGSRSVQTIQAQR